MDNSSATIANTKKRVRKLQHNWTSQQTEQLIEAVQIREGLWNYLSREYRDRKLREPLWDDVAKEMELPRLEVTTKWNSLRCSFRAAFNRMATTKSGQSAKKLSEPSQLYNSLKFLEPTLNSAASTTSNLMDVANNSPTSPTDIMYDVECLETDDLESTPSTSKTTPTPSAKRRRMEKEDADFAKTVESALQTILRHRKRTNGMIWEHLFRQVDGSWISKIHSSPKNLRWPYRK